MQEAVKNKDRSKLQSINNMLNQIWKNMKRPSEIMMKINMDK